MVEPDIPVAPEWGAVNQSLCDPRDSNMSVDHAQAQIPGISMQSHDSVDKIRRAVAGMRWLGHVLADASRGTRAVASTAFKDARQVLLQTELPEAELPFRPLEPKSNAPELTAAIALPEGGRCEVEWGPNPGVTRDLLCPTNMAVMCWLGPRFAAPMLDLAFAFATDYTSFMLAWLMCPATADSLMHMSVQTRAAKLKSSPAITSPGAAVVHLADAADTVLLQVIHAVFFAFKSRGFCLNSIKKDAQIVHVAEFVKSEATQYRDCTTPATTQVQSVLPTTSSFPDVEPNFEDDKSPMWFKTAEYTFDNIKMPTGAALRGDQSAELRWHKYQSDALHARASCMRLSERQIIQHIMSRSCKQSDQHFAVAQETALRPNCTLRQWLECIRDFYFTNGQFRHNVERAWQNYNMTEACDFNEIIHHIKSYYHLIFLDYAHMPGKQTRLEFACILFTKLQHIMSPSCQSQVTSTLVMFMPLSQLLDKFQNELTPAMLENTEKADSVAMNFVSWAIKQLLQVRESANTVRRFSADTSESRFDYAMLYNKRKNMTDKPAQQAAAANIPRPPHKGRHMQTQQEAQPVGHIPFLKEMCNTNSETDLRRFWQELQHFPGVKLTPAFIAAVEKEFAGGPTSLRGALSHATGPLPGTLTANTLGTVQLLCKVYFMFKYKQCGMCPPNRSNPQHAMHKLGDCPCFTNLVPPAAKAAFFADPSNRERTLTPLPTGYQLPPPAADQRHDRGKRNRYDPSNRKGNPKRTRHDAPHIR